MTGPDRFPAALTEIGSDHEIRVLDGTTHTAKDAAAALGCEVGAIASSLLFMTDDGPLLVMTSGAHRVDEKLVGELLGTTLRRATAEEVREHSGYAIGGVSPIGHPAPLRTLVDDWLQRHPDLWAAAGSSNSVFRTTFDELVAMTGGTVARVGD
jgi:prolyl-tRNA editing enzyme YbaK/EbsC (Cys-tRNA(Pro) deacylase)